MCLGENLKEHLTYWFDDLPCGHQPQAASAALVAEQAANRNNNCESQFVIITK